MNAHTSRTQRHPNTYCTQTHRQQTVSLISTTTTVRLGTLGLLRHLGVTTFITRSGNPQAPTDTLSVKQDTNMNTTFMHTDRDIFYTEKVTAFSSSKPLKLEVLH